MLVAETHHIHRCIASFYAAFRPTTMSLAQSPRQTLFLTSIEAAFDESPMFGTKTAPIRYGFTSLNTAIRASPVTAT